MEKTNGRTLSFTCPFSALGGGIRWLSGDLSSGSMDDLPSPPMMGLDFGTRTNDLSNERHAYESRSGYGYNLSKVYCASSAVPEPPKYTGLVVTCPNVGDFDDPHGPAAQSVDVRGLLPDDRKRPTPSAPEPYRSLTTVGDLRSSEEENSPTPKRQKPSSAGGDWDMGSPEHKSPNPNGHFQPEHPLRAVGNGPEGDRPVAAPGYRGLLGGHMLGGASSLPETIGMEMDAEMKQHQLWQERQEGDPSRDSMAYTEEHPLNTLTYPPHGPSNTKNFKNGARCKLALLPSFTFFPPTEARWHRITRSTRRRLLHSDAVCRLRTLVHSLPHALAGHLGHGPSATTRSCGMSWSKWDRRIGERYASCQASASALKS